MQEASPGQGAGRGEGDKPRGDGCGSAPGRRGAVTMETGLWRGWEERLSEAGVQVDTKRVTISPWRLPQSQELGWGPMEGSLGGREVGAGLEGTSLPTHPSRLQRDFSAFTFFSFASPWLFYGKNVSGGRQVHWIVS